ncbi:5-aminolevulinate synthase [Thalassococcus sp. CAU 1522]|uniref:5-aminolevulinate synthase n=1 Tax=Thalassococcus arenae TaxID=2851652 RepID=A0ABS6NAG7_9RHOB|nr:5-aminolevulinate synthase [Thalassococcus arenae]MBV2361015.1 5-aminolevulinate synthase [Thalassococcus arenae]
MTLFAIPTPGILSLILMTALGYAVATVGMKITATGQIWLGVGLCALGFFAAFLAEIVLLRRFDLALVYVVIIAAETALVLGYAFWIGEGFGLRQTFGATLVLLGLLVVTH